MINKDTKIYGSFSKKSGSIGTKLFNSAFQYYSINAIYRSFSVDNIKDAVNAAKTLGFSGFAVSMPFKKEVLKYVDKLSRQTECIEAANTVIIDNNVLTAHNTDYFAVVDLIFQYKINSMYILGNGGLANAAKQACIAYDIKFEIITRENWNDTKKLKNKFIFNCTPVENLYENVIDKSNIFIDCSVNSASGKLLSITQASYQFKLYTNKEFPFKHSTILEE